MDTNLISVVLPAHNEATNVCVIHDRIAQALRDTDVQIEFIFVDDGSRDSTADIVRGIREHDPMVRLIRFSRNFGHQAALLAGIRAATGSAIITMDCDLQHPPELLPQMVLAWRDGAPIVQMERRDTEGVNWLKKGPSALFYRIMRVLSDQQVHLGPDFQLLDRKVVDTILGFRESRPFVRGIVGWVGFPVQRFEFIAARRVSGISGFSTRRMFRLALDGVTALSTKPLRLASSLGLVVAVVSFGYALFALTDYIRGISVPGWTSLIITVLFLGAVQLIFVGILGEYIGRIYELARRVPPYVVQQEDPPVTQCSRKSAADGNHVHADYQR